MQSISKQSKCFSSATSPTFLSCFVHCCCSFVLDVCLLANCSTSQQSINQQSIQPATINRHRLAMHLVRLVHSRINNNQVMLIRLVSSNLNHAAAWSVNTFNAIHHASNHAWLLGNNGALRAMMQTIG
jgi:hypothetical protein